MKHWFPVAGSIWMLLALTANAATEVTNQVPGPLSEFGAAAIRSAAGGLSLGRVAISVTRDLKPEAFRIRAIDGGYAISGGDARGAMYGALDFAEQLELSARVRDKEEQPSLPVRALKFNVPLPGTGYLSEEDLANNQWFWSLDYWRKFLDMAARNRYNAITFWSAHPYGRMVRVPKYPEAADVPAAELDKNITFFRQLFQMAADRGLDTYLVTWNIHVSRAFAQSHRVPASGFDSPLVRDYQREAIKALFATYPTLTGLGTTAGERMDAMTAKQKMDWIADTYFAALKQLARPVRFILRYWQAEPESLAAMLASANYPGPVYLDIKFNGEHMYSSVEPHVLDPKWVALAHGRYRLLWHLRNDDVFILRWGDPDFVRETVRHMAGADTAGFVEGSEVDVPGPDRIHTETAKAHLDWQYKFEKHWFRYMLWGRVGYNAAEPDATWLGHFQRRFGAAGDDVYEAMHQSGKIVPLITSYHWNYMNGDWYPEGSIGSWNTSYEQPRINYRRAAMYHDIRTYIFNNTIGGEMANIPEFVAGSKKTSPLEVADRLEQYGTRTLDSIARARGHVERGAKEFACTDADLMAYGNLGIYYAEKLRGAAHLARWMFGAGEPEQKQALAHLELALKAWRGVVAATENHYVTHEVWLFGQFDWKRYLPDVEADIRIAREARPLRAGSTYDLQGLHAWLEYANGLLGRANAIPPAATQQPVRVEAEAAASITPPLALGEDASGGQGKYVGVAAAAPAARPESESITGARDFVSPAASATYRIEIPADGAYLLSAVCWWGERAGGFTVLVDESNMRDLALRPSKDAPLGSWTTEKLAAPLYLGAGSHTVRIVGRTPGARIARFELAPAPAGGSTPRF
ncbi:MAG: hypothetical protein ABSC05_30190 [Candidatus Solibacter sp.]|jgi:hypothetical protein